MATGPLSEHRWQPCRQRGNGAFGITRDQADLFALPPQLGDRLGRQGGALQLGAAGVPRQGLERRIQELQGALAR